MEGFAGGRSKLGFFGGAGGLMGWERVGGFGGRGCQWDSRLFSLTRKDESDILRSILVIRI